MDTDLWTWNESFLQVCVESVATPSRRILRVIPENRDLLQTRLWGGPWECQERKEEGKEGSDGR